MKKPFLTVYLTPDLLERLVAQARRRGVPKSTVSGMEAGDQLVEGVAKKGECQSDSQTADLSASGKLSVCHSQP